MPKLTLNYFKILFLMSAIPSLKGFFPFIPDQIGGFNLTGWAWLTVFIVSVVYLFFIKKIYYPRFIWMPWIIYLIVSLFINFSFLGLQLTFQYMVSILVGWVISGLYFNNSILKKIIRWFVYLVFFIKNSTIKTRPYIQKH